MNGKYSPPTEQMGDRKWEELPMDCLVLVFARAGLESLVEAVPFVCKSWYKATLSPLCWQSLIFPTVVPDPRRSKPTTVDDGSYDSDEDYPSFEAFVKFAVGRSRGSATTVIFPRHVSLTDDVLDCIGQGCPLLKILVFTYVSAYHVQKISSMIHNFKYLEALRIDRCYGFKEIIREISIYCKKFEWLRVNHATVGEDEASAIATLLPDIKGLSLRCSSIERSNLVIILEQCRKLVHLDVSKCIGFEGDDEILKLAAHIATFEYEGSKLGLDYDDLYFDYPISSRDVDFGGDSD